MTHGRTRRRDLLQRRGDESASRGIQPSRGLVDEQHARRGRELQRDRQAAPLADREIERMPRRPLRDARGVRSLAQEARPAGEGRAAGLSGPPVGVRALRPDRVAHEQIVGQVGDEGDPAGAPVVLRRRPPRGRAADGDGRRGIRNRDRGEQARLAGSVRSHECGDLAGPDAEGRPRDREVRSVADVETCDLEATGTGCRIVGQGDACDDGGCLDVGCAAQLHPSVGDLVELGDAVLGDDHAHAGVVRERTEQRDDLAT